MNRLNPAEPSGGHLFAIYLIRLHQTANLIQGPL
ncbi:hypothetical protein JMJ77_0006897 [Colletotrichum scovillei]|uniref:Uncharacterized protein n=1 Tax=Colletotrichum scovillei TaxID=1209932 RepID=A0A9P7RLA0_9PEZI|nr:hypothetical protein JMJ77_0006897 [Colletotrichum scovillei]KAG7078142.1 hypothetical protein JMJ76_0015377 [Colletotrichum scovillei]KAG7085253.1 hypothetical protein JMJ78_0010678 [Colletotrichum scovillei]